MMRAAETDSCHAVPTRTFRPASGLPLVSHQRSPSVGLAGAVAATVTDAPPPAPSPVSRSDFLIVARRALPDSATRHRKIRSSSVADETTVRSGTWTAVSGI